MILTACSMHPGHSYYDKVPFVIISNLGITVKQFLMVYEAFGGWVDVNMYIF